MFDSRRYIGPFAVLAIVVLRLVVGWHFFREGTDKVVYDPHDGQLRMKFSASGFLTNAKGPLADWYHANAPDDHDWRGLLATPRQNVRPTGDQSAEHAKWQADYEKRRAEAQAKGEPVLVEFPPSAPYRDWAERIKADWRNLIDELKTVPAIADEQEKKADEALSSRLQKLADYLATQAEAITEYRHELWRLDNWRKSPESGEVPFVDERVATKASETAKTPATWVCAVETIDAVLRSDLEALLTKEQRAEANTTAAVDDALTDPRLTRLSRINVVTTIVTIGVGVCLLLGLFTRVASIVGALFLLGVILSQPPWLPDSIDTMSNMIEFAALLVLAGTAAGRWFGLDYFTYALFNRRHGVTDKAAI
jgi:uncharacterized membrane protein YphA (DoxX/SURF4 family)